MWTAIKKIIPFNINKLGLGSIAEANEVFLSWEKTIAEAIGEKYKQKSRPVSLKNKTLIVDCLNSCWASELQLKQAEILAKINTRLKKSPVEKIRFIS